MKKLVFGLIAVVMVVAMIGSAFAYFTDVETSQSNVFQAGTLDMQISDNNEGFGDTPVNVSFASPTGWAPGDTFETLPVTFKNVGTINIERIYGTFYYLAQGDGATADPELTGVNNIADYIKLVSYSERAGDNAFSEELFDGSVAAVANANSYLAFWGFAQDGVISLADLVAANAAGPVGSSTKTGLLFFDGGNDPTDPPLAVDGTAQIKFKFQLLAITPNNYQGDSASFRVAFVATHNDAYLDGTLDSSITETIGPDYAPEP